MSRQDSMVVVVHRACGHIGTAVPVDHRYLAEAQRKLLAAAGYHQWRVRVEAVTDEMLSRCLAVCDVCRVDPSRALLPAVVAAQIAHPEVAEAAAYGAAIHHAMRGIGDTSP